MPPRESEYTVKLVELLETGKHDYLRQLISSLYALEFPSGRPEPSLSDEDEAHPRFKHLPDEDDGEEEEEEDKDNWD